jgi:hypothetical protein
MFGPSAVTTDILDIGSRNGEDKRRQAMASGSGAMCPSKFLGAPAAFDIPNVADVSSFNSFSSLFLSCIVSQHDVLNEMIDNSSNCSPLDTTASALLPQQFRISVRSSRLKPNRKIRQGNYNSRIQIQ